MQDAVSSEMDPHFKIVCSRGVLKTGLLNESEYVNNLTKTDICLFVCLLFFSFCYVLLGMIYAILRCLGGFGTLSSLRSRQSTILWFWALFWQVKAVNLIISESSFGGQSSETDDFAVCQTLWRWAGSPNKSWTLRSICFRKIDSHLYTLVLGISVLHEQDAHSCHL